jgi:hypothetical protein
MYPLAFKIECDVEGGVLVASWDDPEGSGITTQAKNLTELAEALRKLYAVILPADPRRAKSLYILRVILYCSWREAAARFIWSTRGARVEMLGIR